jgi:hypothetical protein
LDVVGLLAAVCVLATFCMQSMLALRTFAILSNVLFIIYGAGAQLAPIVLLHSILLPINGWSLGRQWGGPSLGRKLAVATGCWSGLLLGVMLGSDITQAGNRAIDTIRDWLAH